MSIIFKKKIKCLDAEEKELTWKETLYVPELSPPPEN